MKNVAIRPEAFASILVGLLLALVWACSNSPTAPLPATGAKPPRLLSAVRITAPASVAPGATVQLSNVALYSDGSTEDVTSQTQWRTSNGDVLSVSSSGSATGNKPGEATVSTVYAGRFQQLSVMVLPPGTYRLSGKVVESGLPVSGVAVDVTAGQGAGLSTTTDANGFYGLYGVAGDVQVQVSKAAYVAQSRALNVTANTVADFQVTTVNPEPNVAGTYQLTLTAGPCFSSRVPRLPDTVGQQRYTVVLTQTAQHLVATLNGNQSTSPGFSGRVEPDRVTFNIRGYDDYYDQWYQPLDFAEKLDDGKFLLVSGQATTTYSGANLVGTLSGAMAVASTALGNSLPVVGQCASSNHQFVLTRDSSGTAAARSRR